MSDFLHALLQWVDYNRYIACGALVTAALLVTLTACEPKAVSPFDGQRVTQTTLEAQVQAYQAKLDGQVKTAELTYQQTLAQLEADAASYQAHAQAAVEDIQRRKQALQLAMESLAQLTSAAAGPEYASMIGSAVGIAGVLLGTAAAADSRRKDQIILAIKQTPTNSSASTTSAA